MSKLGYNSDNTIFGISFEMSSNYNLLKFTIEQNAYAVSLMEPNLDMVGNTVVTIAFYNTETDEIYYFQFVCNSIQVPADLTIEEEMFEYELANI